MPTTNAQRAELALSFVGLFLAIASWWLPSPVHIVLAAPALALSLTMLVRSVRSSRAGRGESA